MKDKRKQLSRITAIMLTALMIFSSVAFDAGIAWADTLPEDENTVEETGSGQADAEENAGSGEAASADSEKGSDQDLTGTEKAKDEEPSDKPAAKEESKEETAVKNAGLKAAGVEAKTEEIPSVEIRVVRKSGRDMTLEWTGPKDIPDAADCRLYVNNSSTGISVSFDTGNPPAKLSYTCTGLQYKTKYSFRVRYFKENGDEIVSSEQISATSAVEPPKKRSIGNLVFNNPPRLLVNGAPFNLREYAGEPYNGFSIVQGSCVDNKGEYSYYCMVDDSDYGKLVKIRMSDNACVAVSGKQRFTHGAGMCYDSKRNKVVIATHDNYRRTLNFVDPDSLNIVEKKNLNDTGIRSRLGGRNATGVSALAYNAKYDCYVGMQKTHHNIIIYDAETLTAKAAALTEFGNAYPGVFQSVDADDTYMYFLLSKDEPAQPNNILVAFDWHAEKYEALLNGTSTEDMWYCGSGNGYPSAVITIIGAHEIESMYHTDAGNGRGHFYLVNYNNDPVYKIIEHKTKWKKVKKKVKVKWKKVTKKVKWKKVKTKKGKKKWKYKKKKVWKYKWKKKKVWKYKITTEKKFKNYNRDNYVMYLGEF